MDSKIDEIYIPKKEDMIYVPALVENERVIIPEFWLGKDLIEGTGSDKDVSYKFDSASENINKMKLPTLAELRYAFFGGSDDYKRSVLAYPMGEFTSTLLKDSKIIERPEKIALDSKWFKWNVEGGKVTQVELPPNGWVLEYDKPTGIPSRTSKAKEDSEKNFGSDASFFMSPGVFNYYKILFLPRSPNYNERGPFQIYYCDLGDCGRIMGRHCIR